MNKVNGKTLLFGVFLTFLSGYLIFSQNFTGDRDTGPNYPYGFMLAIGIAFIYKGFRGTIPKDLETDGNALFRNFSFLGKNLPKILVISFVGLGILLAIFVGSILIFFPANK